MTERKWTPGPWAKDRFECLRSPEGQQVGLWGAGFSWVSRSDEAEANAHLIAAAPDMYELADLVNSSFGGGRTITFSDYDIARFASVLAKARGEAQ